VAAAVVAVVKGLEAEAVGAEVGERLVAAREEAHRAVAAGRQEVGLVSRVGAEHQEGVAHLEVGALGAAALQADTRVRLPFVTDLLVVRHCIYQPTFAARQRWPLFFGPCSAGNAARQLPANGAADAGAVVRCILFKALQVAGILRTSPPSQ
jgi:hypothetical protein